MLCRYWQKHPPSHKLLAAWMGHKPHAEQKPADFAAAAAATADWFKHPDRFFSTGFHRECAANSDP